MVLRLRPGPSFIWTETKREEVVVRSGFIRRDIDIDEPVVMAKRTPEIEALSEREGPYLCGVVPGFHRVPSLLASLPMANQQGNTMYSG
jgi:hypothetical protein